MTHTTEERRAKFRALLESNDDEALFTQGGCGIFAAVLHLEFGYRLRCIPSGKRISHIYAHLDGSPEYAVDATGTKVACDRVRDFDGDCAPFLTLDELWAKFGLLEEPDRLVGDAWFTIPAARRACTRIQRYRSYFDGTKKDQIPK